MGSLAAVGIVKGKPFNPDARMKKILTDAAAIGTAVAEPSTGIRAPPKGPLLSQLRLDDDALGRRLQLRNAAAGGQRRRDHHRHPPTGARTLNSRTAFFFYATFITPAMIMRLTGIRFAVHRRVRGLQRRILRRRQDLQGHAAEGLPAEKFWSLTVYDNQTRSMLDTPQRYPRAGSQSYPTPAAESTPMALRRSTSARSSLTASSPATGFRPCPVRGGARSCASTARSNRSSRRHGAERDRANWRSYRCMRTAFRLGVNAQDRASLMRTSGRCDHRHRNRNIGSGRTRVSGRVRRIFTARLSREPLLPARPENS